MDTETIVAVSVLGGGCLLLLVLVAVLFSQVTSLRRRLEDIIGSGRLRAQKVKLDTNDKNHAFHNPTISPDEELARRGFSMYSGDDVEGGRDVPTERQTGGQLLDELSRELDQRHRRQQQDEMSREMDQRSQRQQHQQPQRPPTPDYNQPSIHQPAKQQQGHPPPFLLQSIEENKRKTRQSLANPVANPSNRQLSETNPNFIY